MSVLYVENIPDDLYQRIEQLASAKGLSVGEEAVQLLERAVNQKQRQTPVDIPAILAEIRRNAIVPSPDTPDSVELLREDRSR